MRQFFSHYRPLQNALYVFLLCLLTFAIINFASKIWDDLRNLETANTDNIYWVLSQLEVDFLNLRLEQEAILSNNDLSVSPVRRKFDILYSRMSTLRQGSAFSSLNADPNISLLVESIWDYLQKTTDLIDGPDALIKQNIASFSDQTEQLKPKIRALSLQGIDLYAEASNSQRRNFSQTLVITGSLTFILLSALMASMWVFLRQYQHIRESNIDTLIASSRLNAIVTSSLDAVIVIDSQAKMLEFNAAAEEIFGYSKDEAVGGNMAELIIPDHLRQAHNEGMKRYLETGKKRVVGKGRIRLEAKRKCGTVFPVELSISSAESHDGIIFVAFLRDISKRVAQEEEVKQARDDALAGEKAKAELLAVMSHEMRTPLNGMIGTLELMKDTHLSERQAQYLDIINASGRMLLHHVNDVLDISRLDSGKFEASASLFDLYSLMNEICDSQRPSAAARGNTIYTNYAQLKGTVVKGDELRLRQILLNILGNAVKFTKNESIRVEAESHQNSWIEFRVLDKGVGIDLKDTSRIFDDFVTLDSSYEREQAGTGLGLGITKRMVKAMGGELGVDSELGQGSLFWFRLPLPKYEGTTDKNLGKSDDKIEGPLPKNKKSQKVLIIEDNEINRFVARELLEKDGHIVSEANDGDEGVALCQKEAFDIILMDISMPRMDGVEATARIRSGNGPNAASPIIALTAHALPDEMVRFNRAGMNGTLIKPISKASLRNIVNRSYDRRMDINKPRGQDHATGLIDDAIFTELKETLGVAKTDQLIAKFCDEVENVLDWMSEHNGQASAQPDLIKRVHKLAGSASLFGIIQFRDMLHDIEAQHKLNPPSKVAAPMSEMQTIWADTKSSLLTEHTSS